MSRLFLGFTGPLAPFCFVVLAHGYKITLHAFEQIAKLVHMDHNLSNHLVHNLGCEL